MGQSSSELFVQLTIIQTLSDVISCPCAYAPRQDNVWGSGGKIFFSSLMNRGEFYSRSNRFSPGEKSPCTYWLGGWVAPRFDLNPVQRGKSLSCRQSKPSNPARGVPLF